jgi:predicted kinase
MELHDQASSPPDNPPPLDRPRSLAGAIPLDREGPTIQIQTLERHALRQLIADTIYGIGAKRKEKRLDIVIGAPLAGKTTVVTEPLRKQHGSVVINTDEACAYIPEYRPGVSESKVQDEAAHIAGDLLVPRAMEAGDNIVIEAVGKSADKMSALADAFKDAGYKVYVHLVTASPEQLQERAKRRMEQIRQTLSPASDGSRPQGEDREFWFTKDDRDEEALLRGAQEGLRRIRLHEQNQPPRSGQASRSS